MLLIRIFDFNLKYSAPSGFSFDLRRISHIRPQRENSPMYKGSNTPFSTILTIYRYYASLADELHNEREFR